MIDKDELEKYKKSLKDVDVVVHFLDNVQFYTSEKNSDPGVILDEYNYLSKNHKSFKSLVDDNTLKIVGNIIKQYKHQEELFNKAVATLLTFCLDKVYKNKRGFRYNFNLFRTDWSWQHEIIKANIKKDISLLNDVKKYYSSKYKYAKLFSYEEWVKFFNDKKCDIIEYVIKTSLELIKKGKEDNVFDEKLDRFYYNYYASSVFGTGGTVLVGTDRKVYPNKNNYFGNNFYYAPEIFRLASNDHKVYSEKYLDFEQVFKYTLDIWNYSY